MNRPSGAAARMITSNVNAWKIPAMGDTAPERMLVAVRAIAPVAGMPPNSGRYADSPDPGDELDVGLVAVAAHVVGHHRREQTFDGGQQGHRKRHGSSGRMRSTRNSGKRRWRQARGNAAEFGADGFQRRSPNKAHTTVVKHKRHDGSRQLLIDLGHNSTMPTLKPPSPLRPDRRRRVPPERHHSRHELDWGPTHVEAEKIFDLRRGDKDGDAVGEPDRDRPRNESHRGAQSGQAHHDQHDASHRRAHQQAGDAELRDNAGDDHDERAGRPGDLAAASRQAPKR